MDVLSDVLSLLKPRSYMYGGFDVGGELSLQVPHHEGIKCYAVVSGECFLSVEGVSKAVHIKTGDCFLLTRGLPFQVASDLGLPPVDIFDVIPAGRTNGSISSFNNGGKFLLVGGHFLIDGYHAKIFLETLPPIVHIHKASEKSALQWSIERMMQELRDPQSGSSLITQYLASMVLVHAIRAYQEKSGSLGIGWLFALADKQIGAAINAIHRDPSYRWTLQTLAAQASMSRSSFAQKFKAMVGEAPLEYLTRWRMLLAVDRLVRSSDPVSAIALSLGYQSESAFSTAFKRVIGCSPRRYGAEHLTVMNKTIDH